MQVASLMIRRRKRSATGQWQRPAAATAVRPAAFNRCSVRSRTQPPGAVSPVAVAVAVAVAAQSRAGGGGSRQGRGGSGGGGKGRGGGGTRPERGPTRSHSPRRTSEGGSRGARRDRAVDRCVAVSVRYCNHLTVSVCKKRVQSRSI